MDHPTFRVSMTPTVARQSQKQEFGDALKGALEKGAQISGSLLNAVPGGGIISAAVSQVTALANQPGRNTSALAATGVVGVGSGAGGSAGPGGTSVTSSVNATGATPGTEFNGYLDQMRSEADRSMMMQLQMQNESRDYNTLSNVLKVRHDSAKAAINNIR